MTEFTTSLTMPRSWQMELRREAAKLQLATGKFAGVAEVIRKALLEKYPHLPAVTAQTMERLPKGEIL